MKKKVLVTGGNGFIGSEVCKLLLKKNYVVHGVIRRSSSFNTSADVMSAITSPLF